IATFNDLSIAKAGEGYTLTAASTGLSGTESAAFSVTPRAAKLLVFTVQPSSTPAGAVITPAVQVTARDSLGNTATSYTGTVTVAIGSNPAGGSLSGTKNQTAGSGVASFADLSIDKASAGYTLTASATGLTQATSTSFTIGAGAAAKLALTTAPSSSASSGVALTQQPIVQVQDAGGNPVSQSGDVVTATIASGPGGATLTNATATTGSSGAAPFSGLAISGPTGTYTLSFAATGLTAVTSSGITLGAGTATKLALSTEPSSSASSGVTFTQQPVVQVQDANGNPVSQNGDVVTATIASGPAGATLTNATATTGSSGAAPFSGLAISGPTGTYTLSFAATGLTAVTSSGITLGAGTATKLALSTEPSSSASSGVTFTQQPVVQVQDANGNPVSQNGDVVTATIASGPAGATLTNATATTGSSGAAPFSGLAISGPTGTYTLSFAATGLTAVTSSGITLGAGTATKLALSTEPSSSASSGVAFTQQPVVQVQDANGNAVSQSGDLVTATIASGPAGATLSNATATTGSSGAAPFSGLAISGPAGPYPLTSAAPALTAVTSSGIALGAGTASQVALSTQPSSTAQSGLAFAQQ